jgi:hypothetical protein
MNKFTFSLEKERIDIGQAINQECFGSIYHVQGVVQGTIYMI